MTQPDVHWHQKRLDLGDHRRTDTSSAAAYTDCSRAAGSPISSSSAGAPYEARLSYS